MIDVPAMRSWPIAVAALGGLAYVAAACTASPTGRVEDLGSGIYRIAYSAKSDAEAIRKAGEFCHAKGQKLSVEYSGHDYKIRFRCVAPE